MRMRAGEHTANNHRGKRPRGPGGTKRTTWQEYRIDKYIYTRYMQDESCTGSCTTPSAKMTLSNDNGYSLAPPRTSGTSTTRLGGMGHSVHQTGVPGRSCDTAAVRTRWPCASRGGGRRNGKGPSVGIIHIDSCCAFFSRTGAGWHAMKMYQRSPTPQGLYEAKRS